jgi:hypothetical protein
VHVAAQTAQRFIATGRSASIDFFAISRISGAMMGAVIAFFFITFSLYPSCRDRCGRKQYGFPAAAKIENKQ